MASLETTASFFANGNSKQFDYVLQLYPQVLKLKAETRTKKPEELIKLDDWYQNELPELIKQRGKDAHMLHEELVQAMKWKQSRGKFSKQLLNLIKINTPRAVVQETKRAFRKLPNLEQALTALTNLKGVGTTMASALLTAAAPDNAPFMADECLMAIPDIEGIDYTTKVYLNFATHVNSAVTRLNMEKDNNNSSWSAHRVELAVWTHCVASELQPELLEGLPPRTASAGPLATITTTTTTTTNGNSAPLEPSEPSDESNSEPPTAPNGNNGNGVSDSLDESTRSEDSLEKPITPIVANDETNDSDSQSSAKRSLDCESSESQTETSEPDTKKLKIDE
ncbi:hypothetical protein HA402_015288 [Bradysia odoriphaga]|nr:hypothetical protein HA402_015288 [Bradysia odoriphaga]